VNGWLAGFHVAVESKRMRAIRNAVNDLCRRIESAFRSTPFHGAITPVDGEPWREEIDDDLELSDRLKGNTWGSLSAEFIDLHSSNLPLLTPGACAAFPPAWLTRGLDLFDGDNEVRERIVCLFSPREFEADWATASRDERLGALTAPQREVLQEFLMWGVKHERSAHIRIRRSKLRSQAIQALGAM
jgi:hypothetical protein